MSFNWNAGYLIDTDYAYSYFRELHPLYLQFLLLTKGYQCFPIKTACELGFGQGLSINIHATTSDISWYGNDFITSQVENANKIAKLSQNNAKLYDDSFQEFLYRTDLPQFDFIGLHGVWSWISDENREIILKFIQTRLSDNGIVYISYNSLPGQNNIAPLRELFVSHEKYNDFSNDTFETRIKNSLFYTEKILHNAPNYTKENTDSLTILKKLQTIDNPKYLAHEYFHENWKSMYFSEIAKNLESLNLHFACSAHTWEHLDFINFSEQQKKLLSEIQSPIFRETVRDFLFNKCFRKDIWIKNPQKLPKQEQKNALRKLSCILTCPLEKAPQTIHSLQGEMDVKDIYAPFYAILGDNKIHTLEELENTLRKYAINLDHIINVLLCLNAQQVVSITQNPSPEIKEKTRKLNAFLLQQTYKEMNMEILISPYTGEAFPVKNLYQLFIQAYTYYKEKNSAEYIAKYTLDFLTQHNIELFHKGKKHNIVTLMEETKNFMQELPLLQQLGIIEKF